MDDIRRLERETQLALQEKMTNAEMTSDNPASADGKLTAGNFHFSSLVSSCFLCIHQQLASAGILFFGCYYIIIMKGTILVTLSQQLGRPVTSFIYKCFLSSH